MDTNTKLREMIIERMKSGKYELKPCPFCGGKPVIEDKETFEKLQDDTGSACLVMECDTCDLDFYDHTHDEHDYYIRMALLIDKWNRRTE